jgi:Zn ribbon nucleic-acid-binding protein
MAKGKVEAVKPVEEKPRYVFKSPVRCPRCQAPDTIATSTQGEVQWRKCQRPVCRHTFKVIGEPA